MTMAADKQDKVLNCSSEREQNGACSSSAERENNQGKDFLNVPTLRFPEFTDEWISCKVGDFGKIITGSTPPTSDNTNYADGTRLWASPVDLGQTKYVIDTQTKLSPIGFGKTRKLPAGCVLVTCIGSTIGKMGMAATEMSTNQQINSIVVNAQNDKHFVYYALQSRFPRYLTSVAVQAVPIMSKSSFEKLQNYRTTLEEQKKIGALLNLIDERISTQIRIINEMQSLISGITQRISKHSSVRMVLLSELLVERNEKNTELFPVHSVSVSEGVINQIDYLGRSFSAADTSHYNVAHRGDIIYTKSPTGEFPFGIVKRNSVETNVSVSPLYGVYKPVSDEVALYIHYYFCSPLNAQNYLHKLIQKGAKNTINITNQRFLENIIPLPDKKTLTGFVKLISAVSAKLELEKSLLETLQTQKRYLLTQMFV